MVRLRRICGSTKRRLKTPRTGPLIRWYLDAKRYRLGDVRDAVETVTLWRPVGPDELQLIEKAAMRAFPPRLPGQPIFYPVLTEEYAVQDRSRLECAGQRVRLCHSLRRAEGFPYSISGS